MVLPGSYDRSIPVKAGSTWAGQPVDENTSQWVAEALWQLQRYGKIRMNDSALALLKRETPENSPEYEHITQIQAERQAKKDADSDDVGGGSRDYTVADDGTVQYTDEAGRTYTVRDDDLAGSVREAAATGDASSLSTTAVVTVTGSDGQTISNAEQPEPDFSQGNSAPPVVDNSALAVQLGLPPDASYADIKAASDAHNAEIAVSLGLPADASPEQIERAITDNNVRLLESQGIDTSEMTNAQVNALAPDVRAAATPERDLSSVETGTTIDASLASDLGYDYSAVGKTVVRDSEGNMALVDQDYVEYAAQYNLTPSQLFEGQRLDAEGAGDFASDSPTPLAIDQQAQQQRQNDLFRLSLGTDTAAVQENQRRYDAELLSAARQAGIEPEGGITDRNRDLIAAAVGVAATEGARADMAAATIGFNQQFRAITGREPTGDMVRDQAVLAQYAENPLTDASYNAAQLAYMRQIDAAAIPDESAITRADELATQNLLDQGYQTWNGAFHTHFDADGNPTSEENAVYRIVPGVDENGNAFPKLEERTEDSLGVSWKDAGVGDARLLTDLGGGPSDQVRQAQAFGEQLAGLKMDNNSYVQLPQLTTTETVPRTGHAGRTGQTQNVQVEQGVPLEYIQGQNPDGTFLLKTGWEDVALRRCPQTPRRSPASAPPRTWKPAAGARSITCARSPGSCRGRLQS